MSSITYNNINYNLYYRLMSPEITTDDKTWRQVRWLKHQTSYLITLFNRFVYMISNKKRKWLNNEALFTKFEKETNTLRIIAKDDFPNIEKLAKALISRNSTLDASIINNKMEHLSNASTPKQIPLQDHKSRDIGKKDTFPSGVSDILLNPTLDPALLKKYQNEEKTHKVIRRRKEITQTVETYKKFVEKNEEIEGLLANDRLKATNEGQGGAYFLQERRGKKEKYDTKFVLKPHGEGTYCLDNRKCVINDDDIIYFSGINHDILHRVRKSIPLYFEVLSEVLYYQVAQQLNLDKYVPETFWTIVESEKFFLRYEDPKKRGIKTKLCSAQRFTANEGKTFDISDKKDDKLFINNIDEFSIAASIFLDCLCGNTDRYSDNCLVGKSLQLINIDNGLCFPMNNSEIRICNVLLPQAKEEFPQTIIDLIKNLSQENSELRKNIFNLVEISHERHVNVALPNGFQKNYTAKVMKALKKRIEMMKWAIDKKMSMQEIGLRVISLSKSDEAYREKEITTGNVDPFQIGLVGNKSWKTITPKKKKTPPKVKEIPVESDDDSKNNDTPFKFGSSVRVYDDANTTE